MESDEDLTPYQDEPITADEMAQAAQAMVSCIEEQGFTAQAHQDDRLMYTIGVGGSSDVASSDVAYDKCHAELNFGDITTQWAFQVIGTPDEVQAEMDQCLFDAGLTSAPDITEDELGQLADRVYGDGSGPDFDAFEICANLKFAPVDPSTIN